MGVTALWQYPVTPSRFRTKQFSGSEYPVMNGTLCRPKLPVNLFVTDHSDLKDTLKSFKCPLSSNRLKHFPNTLPGADGSVGSNNFRI